MIDLHVHSNFSDGSFTPRQIAEVAADLKLRALSLTDHDRVDGIDELNEALAQTDVELITGMEISVQLDFEGSGSVDKSAHVLLYFIDTDNAFLNSEIEKLQADRISRNDRLILKLNSCGVKITIEELRAVSKKEGVGRPHFAQLLVNKGYSQTIQEAFDEYLGVGGKAYIPKARLNLNDAVNIAKRSGGLAVLAHPFTISDDLSVLDELFQGLTKIGFTGVESYYGRYDQGQRKDLAALAVNHNLVATGGSDFHGKFKADLFIGTGQGDLLVDDSIVDALKARL